MDKHKDCITIKDISIYSYHGLLPEERQRGQEFLVSLVMEVDLAGVAASDDITYTVNYAEVVNKLQEIFTSNTYNLIETLAEKIAGELLNFTRIKGIEVSVEKPRPPLTATTGGVAVTIYRSR